MAWMFYDFSETHEKVFGVHEIILNLVFVSFFLYFKNENKLILISTWRNMKFMSLQLPLLTAVGLKL